jgi:hypothetical protein
MRRKMSICRAVISMMMSLSLSSVRVLTFSSASRRLPVGLGLVMSLRSGEVERATLRWMVSGTGSGTGAGRSSRSW